MSRTTTIDIKRPEGHIETVDVSDKFPSGLTDQMFETIKKATMEAGKGEPISYSVELGEPDPEILRQGNYDAAVMRHDAKAAVKYSK